ncbi:MAG: two-component system response regulator [Blastococcus sp.]|jgi:two-component system response regulator QseB|nr:two-component system response regulator [Blastococcus sp.]
MRRIPASADAPGAGRRLLLAEDDPDLTEMLTELLTAEGYAVDVARDGQGALHQALNGRHEVAVLDRGLPHVDGLTVLGRLRSAGWSIPVLVLSAFGTLRDRVDGLDAGAEDYLVKPFDVEELLARLRALLRRHLEDATVLRVPGGRLDTRARIVSPSGVPGVRAASGPVVELSGREAALLEVFARRPSRVFGRGELRDRVFPDAEAANVVDTYVHYLRRKLGRRVVRTVHGVGYQLGAVSAVDGGVP